MTLAQLKKRASLHNLVITKSKGVYRIAEDYDSNFICQTSCYDLNKVSQQLDFYSINGRFSNNRFKRDLITGEVLERFY